MPKLPARITSLLIGTLFVDMVSRAGLSRWARTRSATG